MDAAGERETETEVCQSIRQIKVVNTQMDVKQKLLPNVCRSTKRIMYRDAY